MPTKAQQAECVEAIARLREWVKPGDTVWCVLRHMSRSGMSRVIDFKVMRKASTEPDNEPEVTHIGYNVALALGMRYDRQREGVKVSGCGMDMGFHVVYTLGRALWPDGVPCTGDGCNSNEHSNHTCKCGRSGYDHKEGRTLGNYGACPESGCKAYKRHDPRGPGITHRDGGYALKHRWL